MNPEQAQRNPLLAWLLAARPKTLPAALLPVLVGSALAAAHGSFRPVEALLCAAFALLMQVAANFINDLLDFLRGTDGEDRLGPKRACAQGWISPRAMRWGIAAVLIAAGCAGAWLAWLAAVRAALGAAPWLWGMGLACSLFAFLYTALSYRGLGDVLVVVFFGFVPVCGTYFVQTGTMAPAALWLGMAAGLVADTLLILNNYRDRDTDRRSGKLTLVAVLGERFGQAFYLAAGVAGCLCVVPVAVEGHAGALAALLYLLPHVLTWRTMVRLRSGRALDRVLGLTSRNMLIFGLLTAAGLLV